MSKGVIYIARGKKCNDEAIRSAASLKDKSPGMSATIFSTEEIKSPLFDKIIPIEKEDLSDKGPYLEKVKHMYSSPYEHTLFLDSDTFVCGDISELFVLLEKFDVAAAHAELRQSYEVKWSPQCFPDLNTGVILFKKSPAVLAAFSEWFALYKEYVKKIEGIHICDQAAFREVLYKNNLKIAILTPEYNCRFIYPVYVDNEVKILHGRHPDLARVAREINKKTDMRIFLSDIGTLTVHDRHPSSTLLFQKLKRMFKK